MKKIYLVINDTMQHKQIGELCEVLKFRLVKSGGLYLECKIKTKNGNFWAKETDLKDVTIDYYFAKGTNILLWIAALASFTVMVANIYNDGHWYGTVGFAVISFGLFTYLKLKKTEL